MSRHQGTVHDLRHWSTPLCAIQEARLRQMEEAPAFSNHHSGEVNLGLAGNYNSDVGQGHGPQRTSSQQQIANEIVRGLNDSTGSRVSAPGGGGITEVNPLW